MEPLEEYSIDGARAFAALVGWFRRRAVQYLFYMADTATAAAADEDLELLEALAAAEAEEGGGGGGGGDVDIEGWARSEEREAAEARVGSRESAQG